MNNATILSKTQTLKNVTAFHNHTNLKKRYKEIALVLQGGGALGSYQAGVYEEIYKAGIEPTWIAGISIGALNSAIIAGNPPEKRVEQLKAFWEAICSKANPNSYLDFWTTNDISRKLLNNFESKKTMMSGQKGFFAPKFFAMMGATMMGNPKSKPNEISYYDTSMLKETLLKYADFDLINNGDMRVSLGVVNVASGEFSYFDNTKDILRPEHFMASGALPPSFPAVEIDGQYYWDGGLVTNNPIIDILHESKEKNKLVFQVDLWTSEGKLPESFDDVNERTQDIKFSSRHHEVANSLIADKKQSDIIKALLSKIPEHIRKNDPMCKEAAKMAKTGETDLIHLTYKNKNYEGHNKAYEFSSKTMLEHWESGQQNMKEGFAIADLFTKKTLIKTL